MRTVNQVASDGYGTLALLGEGESSDADTAFLTTFDPVLVSALLDVVEAADELRFSPWPDTDAGNDAHGRLHETLARVRELAP